MSRSYKFYNRLMELEKEFEELLVQELEDLSHSSYSAYLSVRSSKYYIGKKSKKPNIIKMERYENEIIQLREKVFGNIQYSIVQVAEALARIYKDRYKFSKDQIVSTAKKVLDQLRKIENDDYSIITESLNHVAVPDNYQVKDIVVKAKKNRFFPMSYKELSVFLDEMKINDAKENRLQIELCNPPIKSLENFPLLQLIPHRRVIINSFPDSFDHELAKKMLKIAIRRININLTHLTYKSGAYVSMIFRITDNSNKLECLKREVRYKEAKYRGGDKFSHSCNPQGKTVEEKLIDSLKLCP